MGCYTNQLIRYPVIICTEVLVLFIFSHLAPTAVFVVVYNSNTRVQRDWRSILESAHRSVSSYQSQFIYL